MHFSLNYSFVSFAHIFPIFLSGRWLGACICGCILTLGAASTLLGLLFFKAEVFLAIPAYQFFLMEDIIKGFRWREKTVFLIFFIYEIMKNMGCLFFCSSLFWTFFDSVL